MSLDNPTRPYLYLRVFPLSSVVFLQLKVETFHSLALSNNLHTSHAVLEMFHELYGCWRCSELFETLVLWQTLRQLNNQYTEVEPCYEGKERR